MYLDETSPVTYMGGGRWTLVDHDIVITSSVSSIHIVESDTLCINTFYNVAETPNGVIMKQNYEQTALSRRFIKNKTVWEFDGYNMYCEWINSPGGMIPAHEPCWVSYPGYGRMIIDDPESGGTRTSYSFVAMPNNGTTPPTELRLIGPDITASFYSSGRTYDKAIIFHVVLTFMRN